LPLDADALLTEGGGQVLGLGRGAVQAILNRHGITRVLAAEGGRTSRGSIGNMRDYVAFLNTLARQGAVDLDAVEDFWIARVDAASHRARGKRCRLVVTLQPCHAGKP